MVEKLNSTVISSLKACTSTPTDWVDCLQSVAMSIWLQPHESTGISPYEMMFGVPMHLPTELEDCDIPLSVSKDQMGHIIPHPPEGKAAVDISSLSTKFGRLSTILLRAIFPERKQSRHFTLNRGTQEFLFK